MQNCFTKTLSSPLAQANDHQDTLVTYFWTIYLVTTPYKKIISIPYIKKFKKICDDLKL